MKFDLMVMILAHENFDFVMDTYQAAQWATNPKTTKIVIAVDADKELAKQLTKKIGPMSVYCSDKRHGWLGCISLTLAALDFFKKQFFEFDHLLRLDYDTLPIQQGLDEVVLKNIVSDKVGILAFQYHKQNAVWAMRTKLCIRDRAFAIQHGHPNSNYRLAEVAQGSAFVLTRGFIERIQKHFENNKLTPETFNDNFQLIDEIWFGYWCNAFGFIIFDLKRHLGEQIAHMPWRRIILEDPRGYEKKGCYLTHGIKRWKNKDVPLGKEDERMMRNYFRMVRGVAPL